MKPKIANPILVEWENRLLDSQNSPLGSRPRIQSDPTDTLLLLRGTKSSSRRRETLHTSITPIWLSWRKRDRTRVRIPLRLRVRIQLLGFPLLRSSRIASDAGSRIRLRKPNLVTLVCRSWLVRCIAAAMESLKTNTRFTFSWFFVFNFALILVGLGCFLAFLSHFFVPGG